MVFDNLIVVFDKSVGKNIIKKEREKEENEHTVGVYTEKEVTKVENCTYSLIILHIIAENTLINPRFNNSKKYQTGYYRLETHGTICEALLWLAWIQLPNL